MAEHLTRAVKHASKLHELKRVSSSSQYKKHQRKGENPVRIPNDHFLPPKCSNSWICKNSACRATLSANDTFCRRCSCCICHLFDDNKDPSLWLECTSSESGPGDACGLSCHIECALRSGKVGVVDLGRLMQLDGSYCCASCGKVSGILGSWKKQLVIAKDARRVDVLCHRIFLSYRLLNGTSRFSELHEFVTDAKAKLEDEVGPLDGVSARMARGIVGRLSVSADVQRLCSLAVENADELMASKSNAAINPIEGSLPAACKFIFEEVTSSSITVLLIELPTSSNDDIIGYKLWYRRTKGEVYPNEPACVFPKDKRRIWISKLQPCTEYSIRIMSYTNTGDSGHSEVKFFTKSVEIIHKNSNNSSENFELEKSTTKKLRIPNDVESDSEFKVRDLGKILRVALAQERGYLESLCSTEAEKCSSIPDVVKLELQEQNLPPVSLQLDLNVATVPDLNEEFTPPAESFGDEGNGCAFVQAAEADDDDFANEVLTKPGEIPAVESNVASCQKMRNTSNGEMQDSDSTLSHESGCLDKNFEYCVKIIRWMECEGYIKKDFRLKLLTWFSLRSTLQERRVVNTFIQTLIDDPCSLAGQLIDSFSDIISCKRPRIEVCSEVCH